MKIEIDENKYEERAQSFLVWLERWIENAVSSSSRIKAGEKEELIESLMWNVSSLLDGSGNLQHDNKAMILYLGFQVDGEEEVIYDEGNIAFHEMLSDGDDEDWAD